jgi:hypothetical protein
MSVKHCLLHGSPKFPQIGIFGLKTYHLATLIVCCYLGIAKKLTHIYILLTSVL